MITEKQRDNRFDNLKGILIILVVFAHILEQNSHYKSEPILANLYSFIYSFHMPVFVFISGYFTRPITDSEKWGRRMASSILIPFLVFH